MPVLDSPFAQLHLIRQPEQQNEPLQAFDAADEYLLNHLAEQNLPKGSRVLVLNDSFGALAVSLVGTRCRSPAAATRFWPSRPWKKTWCATVCIRCRDVIAASQPLIGPFDCVLVKVPKTLALLEEQLIRLQGQLAPGAQVIAGAMIKHLPRAAGDLLERYIGPVQASLAVKKARLLIADSGPDKGLWSRPTRPATPGQPAIELLNHANVFCREGLDIGTRAFLPHLPKNLGSPGWRTLGVAMACWPLPVP
jgi:23S rRNA (guanine1835-N2)-methyltransferase